MKKVVLRKIYVDGYKNLIECESDIHDFNILVGPNNSGKSNFLEVFAFLNMLLFGDDEIRKNVFYDKFILRGNSSVCHIENHVCKPITIVLLFEEISLDQNIKQIKYELSIQCTSPLIKEKEPIKVGFLKEEINYKDKTQTGKPISLLKREGDSFRIRLKSNNFSASNKIDSTLSCLSAAPIIYPDYQDLHTHFTTALGAIINLMYTDVIFASPDELRYIIGKGHTVTFGGIFRKSFFDVLPYIAKIKQNDLLYEKFKNILCKIFDLEDIRFSSISSPEKEAFDEGSTKLTQPIHFFELKMRSHPYSNISEFSDGTLIVTAILALLLSPERKGSLLCIEEPENCLHPKAMKTLVSFLIQESQDTQILITTHSSFLLNLCRPEDVIIARIYPDGGTRFERIKNLKELRKRLARGYVNFGDLLETEFE